MKRVWAAGMLVLAAGLPARADDGSGTSPRSMAMQYVASAFALAELCGSMEPDMGAVTHYLSGVGVDPERNADDAADMTTMLSIAAQKFLAPEKTATRRQSACQNAVAYFGPEGQKVPGLLHLK